MLIKHDFFAFTKCCVYLILNNTYFKIDKRKIIKIQRKCGNMQKNIIIVLYHYLLFTLLLYDVLIVITFKIKYLIIERIELYH